MQLHEIRGLVANTADPSFAVDGFGSIAAWNGAAEELFSIAAHDALGRQCNEVVQGTDECGSVCSSTCTTQQAVRKHRPVGNFDLQVRTANGMRWCNVSVVIGDGDNAATRYAIHILRQNDFRKRLEMLMLELLARGVTTPDMKLPAGQAIALTSSSSSAACLADLSVREREVLKLLGEGMTTAAVAERLHIGRTTVNNHVQHILRKLDSHTRLEAFHRAQRAGLI